MQLIHVTQGSRHKSSQSPGHPTLERQELGSTQRKPSKAVPGRAERSPSKRGDPFHSRSWFPLTTARAPKALGKSGQTGCRRAFFKCHRGPEDGNPIPSLPVGKPTIPHSLGLVSPSVSTPPSPEVLTGGSHRTW